MTTVFIQENRENHNRKKILHNGQETTHAWMNTSFLKFA